MVQGVSHMGNIWIGPWANFPQYMDPTFASDSWQYFCSCSSYQSPVIVNTSTAAQVISLSFSTSCVSIFCCVFFPVIFPAFLTIQGDCPGKPSHVPNTLPDMNIYGSLQLYGFTGLSPQNRTTDYMSYVQVCQGVSTLEQINDYQGRQ